MSMHYIYVECINCTKTEALYTGNLDSEDFDEADWEGETIPVPHCKECKEKLEEQSS